MSADLGIGVRVWIGWCPADQQITVSDQRLKCGVIIDGPFPAGLHKLWRRHWGVKTSDDDLYASEEMLTPIDDGDPEHAEHDKTVEETA